MRSPSVLVLVCGLSLLVASLPSASQTPAPWPSRPVRIVVALAAGGGVDATARILAQKLTEGWGQQVVVENRPGAGGTIAAEAVARAPADGYTLLVHSVGHSITPSLYKLAYDPIADFAPVTMIVAAPNVLAVHPSVPVRSIKELVALARTRPDDLLYSSSGNGSPSHMTMELFKLMTGTRLQHVPYKGTAPGINDLLGGRISVTTASVVSIMPHAAAGRLRALAVVTGRRSLGVPELPTVAEAGVPGFAMDAWYGTFAPAGTPRPIMLKLHEEIRRIVFQPETRAHMIAIGLEPVASPPDEFAAYFRAEIGKWAKVVRAASIKAD